MKLLITGSTGLVGSEAVKFYINKAKVYGIDNNMREYFFGKDASTKKVKEGLIKSYGNYSHFDIDIRDNDRIEQIFKEHGPFDAIIHAAAQPSHDWAKEEPFTDFSVNANGTLVLLENFKKHSPGGVFIFTSTNKVYGDSPNFLPIIEKNTRFEIDESHHFFSGISEQMSIDNSKHSLFGISKLSADVLVQEYGRYFGLNAGIFRCGCITGPSHSGVEQHGFLSYLVKSILLRKEYTVFGYKGKQVRDNIHAYDLVSAFDSFIKNPRKGEVYNMGGSRHSNISIIEAVEMIEQMSGIKANLKFTGTARDGDHIWYISDVKKFIAHYPDWKYQYDIKRIIQEMIDSNQFPLT